MGFGNQVRLSNYPIKFTIGLFLGLLLGIGLTLYQDKNCQSSVCRGDFPVFYASASLASSGNLAGIYRTDLQQQWQNKFWPSLKGEYHFFPYPPYLAQELVWLTSFSPDSAKIIYITISLLLIIISVELFRRMTNMPQSSLVINALIFTNATVLIGVLAGQNIAFSTFLYITAAFLVIRGQKLSILFAGVLLGLTFFKPHFGAVFFFFSFCSLRRRIRGRALLLLGLFLTLASQYFVSAAVLGLEWPKLWLKAVGTYKALDYELNRNQIISIYPLIETILDKLTIFDEKLIILTHLLMSIALLFIGIRYLSKLKADTKKYQLHCLMLAGPFLVITSPHILFYDFGLLLFPALYFFRLETKNEYAMVISLTIVSAIACIWRESFILQPLILIALLVYFYGLKQCSLEPTVERKWGEAK
jgi:hypothetical protein